jgi:hypothetical protein
LGHFIFSFSRLFGYAFIHLNGDMKENEDLTPQTKIPEKEERIAA